MNTIEKIVVRENKVLKLNNVLIREIGENELVEISKITYMMDNYIKSKGNSTIGPMINYSGVEVNENGDPEVNIKLMVQLNNPIHSVEAPYELETQIRVKNCLFARFTEKQENIQFAYHKLGVYAFEKNIKLKGDYYTVFVKEEEENIVADIFMESMKGGELFENI